MPLTNLEKQQRKIAREKAAGMVRHIELIPVEKKAEMKEIARRWRLESSRWTDPAPRRKSSKPPSPDKE